jgi:hypothetical protein
MSAGLKVMRLEHTAAELRRLASKKRDAAQVRRLLAAAIIMPAVNTEAMNEHLIEISAMVAPGAHAILVCDGAGWHQPSARWQLPPYSPELNPMENIWAYLRANRLCNLVWNTYDDIANACAEAWRFFIQDTQRVQSIGQREWATVNQ